MALINFSNAQVQLTFTSPHSANAWALLGGHPWRKVQPISPDGTTNTFILLNAAKASGRTVSGSYDDSTGQFYTLYLN